MQDTDQTQFIQEETSEVGVSGVQLLRECAAKWKWFVLAVIVCAALALLYAKSQTQRYSAYAYVLIKSDIQPGTTAGNLSLFNDLGLNSSPYLLENEIFVFKSSMLHEQVVEKLGLASQYYTKGALRKVNIYDKTPITVTPVGKLPKGGCAIEITPTSDTAFVYTVPDDDQAEDVAAVFGEKISVFTGKNEDQEKTYTDILVTKSDKFSSKWLDTRIIVKVHDKHQMAVSTSAALEGDYADEKAYVLALTFTGENNQMVKDFVNTLIEVYNQDAINDKNRVIINTEEFIAERISDIYDDLGGIDSKIEALKIQSKNPGISSATTTSAYINEGTRYKDAVTEAETQLQLANYIKDYMAGMGDKELIPANIGLADIGLEGQISKYNEECLNYSKVASVTAEANPMTAEMGRSLTVMRENITRSIDSYINTLQIRLNQAKKQEDQSEKIISSVPTQEKQITNVMRQQKIKEELYLYLLNKREENALQLALTEPTAKVIESAAGDDIPVAPATGRILFLGIILGLVIPALVIYLIQLAYSLDTKVHTRKDIEDGCGIPILGEIPCKKKEQAKQEIIVKETGADRVNEAMRIVRGNLDYMLNKRTGRGQVLQTTSTMPGEGKSYVTINLALSCSHVQEKVLVVDLDLRKGSLTKYLGMESHKNGASAYLAGRTDDLDSLIVSGQLHPKLDVLPSGVLPPNPTDMLLGDRFKKMLDALRERYSLILLDTLPYNMVADAEIINRSVDVTVYIVRDGMVEKNYMPVLDRMYESLKIKNPAILLTDTKVGTKRYGYGYGYGEES